MRISFKHAVVRLLLLLGAAGLALPVTGATASTPRAEGARANTAQNALRRPNVPLVQNGSFSTVVDSQEFAIPLMAKLDGSVVPDEIAWSIAPAVVAAPNGPPRPASNEHGLPESPTGSAVFSTLLLLAFFIFRRAQ